ncbi:MAG: FkbM family methyltransferase [Verrucomicrobiota bacterium]
MDSRTKFALLLAKSPVHGLLRRTHRRLSRYIDLAENWNNGDQSTNGEAFLIRKVAPKLRVVFDIGANLGDWSSLVLAVNPICKVYAFEASPATFANLKKRYSGHSQVKLLETGIGDREGSLSFHDHGENSGLSSFVSRERSIGLSAKNIVEARLTTVDAVREKNRLEHIDFVKVDTEGYEMAVLRGMISSFKARKISMVQFEYGGTWLDAHETLANANELLREYGYILYRLRRDALEKIDYDCRQHECFKYSNFIAAESLEIVSQWNIPLIQS